MVFDVYHKHNNFPYFKYSFSTVDSGVQSKNGEHKHNSESHIMDVKD